MKILFIGDSLVAGYPFTVKESIPTNIQTNTNWNVINAGISSGITKDILGSVDEQLKLAPDYAVILCGVNDAIYAADNARGIYMNILSIVQKVLQAGVKPILVSVPVCYPHEAPTYNSPQVSTGMHCGVNLVEHMFRKATEVVDELHNIMCADWSSRQGSFIDLYSIYKEHNKYSQNFSATAESYKLIGDILSDELSRRIK